MIMYLCVSYIILYHFFKQYNIEILKYIPMNSTSTYVPANLMKDELLNLLQRKHFLRNLLSRLKKCICLYFLG